ncbi:MAG: hypothetical protein A2Z01_06315 [Betaproteobacteria bacterium RBG_16_58_11]|nr:MAG: hypothetical protein A2Z01_06315 [Betaproteobacteria bacterium RBG_16_58_11]
MKRTALLIIALAALLPMHAALATTTLTSVRVSPANPKVGETVTITVNGTLESANCGIRMEYGGTDMPREEFVLSDKGGQLPFTISKTFSKSGTYKIEALGRKVGKLTFGCEGNVSTMVTVAAADRYTAPSAAAAPMSMAGACPDGWDMIAGQKDPSKGFTCAPKKPAARLDCGPWLTYFEKGGLIGCKKKK